MKAFSYLIAGMTLLTIAVAQLSKSSAPNNSLGNGWEYKGCYSYAFHHFLQATLPTHTSDSKWSLVGSDHALSGSFVRQSPNGGVLCTKLCRAQGYKYAGTNDNQCCTSTSFDAALHACPILIMCRVRQRRQPQWFCNRGYPVSAR